MMQQNEYVAAVKSAKRIMGFIAITDTSMKGVKLTKKSAMLLARLAPDGEPVRAMWGDVPDNSILFVG